MITYSVNKWGFSRKMLMLRGSVFPKAIIWAVPTAALAGLCWWYNNVDQQKHSDVKQSIRKDVASQILYGFTSVLGFLLIFRTQKAYGRYWECAMYLQKARGEWFNAASNLVSFCSPKPEKLLDSKMFQQQLVRLISLLFCSAIGEVCTMEDPSFEVIDTLMDNESVVYLQSKVERCEIVMAWIQRLVVDNIRTETIQIAPPIVSRVFQEFSLGIVNIAAAKKITIIPFPFPYSQMMQWLLMFQAVVVPGISGYATHKWWVASLQTFVIVFLTWCIHFIAMEIEMPFGDDANDLPLSELITNMNDSLFNLLEHQAQRLPTFALTGDIKTRGLTPEDRVTWSAKGRTEAPVISPTASTKSHSEHMKHSVSSQPVVVTMSEGAKHQPVAPAAVPMAATASMGAPPQQALSADTGARLAQISASIEGNLARISEHLGFCPRVEERLDRIGSELQQITKCSMRFMERTERIDKASLGRPASAADASNLWFCGERQAAQLATMEDAPQMPYNGRGGHAEGRLEGRLPAMSATLK